MARPMVYHGENSLYTCKVCVFCSSCMWCFKNIKQHNLFESNVNIFYTLIDIYLCFLPSSDGEVLKCSIIVTFLSFLCFCFIHFKALFFSTFLIAICVNEFFYLLLWNPLISANNLSFILSDINLAISSLLWSLFALYIFFSTFLTYGLYIWSRFLIDSMYLSLAFLFTVNISAFSLVWLHFMFLLIGLILCQSVPSRFLLLLLLLSICSSYINFFSVNWFSVHPLYLLILN